MLDASVLCLLACLGGKHSKIVKDYPWERKTQPGTGPSVTFFFLLFYGWAKGNNRFAQRAPPKQSSRKSVIIHSVELLLYSTHVFVGPSLTVFPPLFFLLFGGWWWVTKETETRGINPASTAWKTQMTFLGSKLCSSFRHAQIDSPIDWDDVSFPNSIYLKL